VLPYVLSFSNIGQELRQVCILRAVNKPFKTAVDICCSGTMKLHYFVNRPSKAEKLGTWISNHGHLLLELDVHMVGGEAERAAIAAGLRAAAAAARAAPERKLKLQRYIQQTGTFPTIIAALPPESLTHLDIAPVNRDPGAEEPSSPPAAAAAAAANPVQQQQQQAAAAAANLGSAGAAAAGGAPQASGSALAASAEAAGAPPPHPGDEEEEPSAAAPQPTIAAALSSLTSLRSLSIKSPLDWFSYRRGWDFLDVTPYLPALPALSHLTQLHLRQVPPKEQQKAYLPPQLLELTLEDGAVKGPLTGGGGPGAGPADARTVMGYQLMPLELRLGHLKQLTRLDLFGEAGTIGFMPVGSRIRSGSVLPPKLRELRALRTKSIEPLLGLERLEVFDDR
jgi:hypothetical protein